MKLVVLALSFFIVAIAHAQAPSDCGQLPKADELKKLLKDVPTKIKAGGFAGGKNEWAAVVDREGVVCALTTSTDDPTAPWPASRQIALAKAYTANANSSDTTPMSTARLYTLSQPGHSLFGAAAGNPFKAACEEAPGKDDVVGKVCGGAIAFAGGIPLYKDGKKVGGLGLSGDTACADMEVAKVVRDRLQMNPPKGKSADDIVFASVDGPSIYAHPICPNTYRNGKKIGNETPSRGYKKEEK